ncbi:MAG: DNA gyrase inhibitor YacG [Gammaproteobacteria bacterium]|nr:DNA gyrase inhibitor YacG [Gammaproteobacteria bacterium]
MEKKAPCPRCGQPARLDESNPWRPFCCRRCKLIDLGDWVAGRYGIPADDREPPPAADGESRQ